MNLTQFETINDYLQQVSVLVDLYDKKHSSFNIEVKRWFRQTELALHVARLPIVATIAARRANILAAERGTRPEGIALPKRASKRRICDAVAIHSLSDVQSIVLEALSTDQDAYSQAERLIRSVLVTANRKGVLNNGIQPPFTAANVRDLWRDMVADETVGMHTSQVLSLVSFRDALTLISRVLNEWAHEMTLSEPVSGSNPR